MEGKSAFIPVTVYLKTMYAPVRGLCNVCVLTWKCSWFNNTILVEAGSKTCRITLFLVVGSSTMFDRTSFSGCKYCLIGDSFKP